MFQKSDVIFLFVNNFSYKKLRMVEKLDCQLVLLGDAGHDFDRMKEVYSSQGTVSAFYR